MNTNDKIILRWFFYFDLLKQLLLEISNPSIKNPKVNCVVNTANGLDCVAILDYEARAIITVIRDERLDEIERIPLTYEQFIDLIQSMDKIVVEPLDKGTQTVTT